MALTTGLAVGEALQQLRPGLEIGLKWPNDVCVRSRKIAGILVEVPTRAPDRVVLGVGVNVNNSVAGAPGPLADTATSLLDVTGYAFDLTVVLVHTLRKIADELAALAHADSALAHRWTVLCMLTGRQVRVEVGRRVTTGTCQGIDESGALQIETAHGLQHCRSGVVTVLGDD
jgi:BirA family biotin operon repressor/biotin-[acetyl-CoA-carboxylase] ligase